MSVQYNISFEQCLNPDAIQSGPQCVTVSAASQTTPKIILRKSVKIETFQGKNPTNYITEKPARALKMNLEQFLVLEKQQSHSSGSI